MTVFLSSTSNFMKSTFLSSLNAHQVSLGLRHSAPDLARRGQARLLADGFSSYVFCVGDAFIVRVAKTREAGKQQLTEFRHLLNLQGNLSVHIPLPKWQLAASEYFPFGAMAYPMIAGRPFDLSLAEQVDLEQVAYSLARFMLELHELSPSVAISKRDDEAIMLWQALEGNLEAYLNEASYNAAKTWWQAFLESKSHNQARATVVHGDLWGENIILDESLSKVIGIIDFELLSYGDSAQDFAPQAYVSAEFAAKVVQNYKLLGGQLGNHFEQRVYDWSVIRELRGLQYAIAYPDSHELEDSLEKVTRFFI